MNSRPVLFNIHIIVKVDILKYLTYCVIYSILGL